MALSYRDVVVGLGKKRFKYEMLPLPLLVKINQYLDPISMVQLSICNKYLQVTLNSVTFRLEFIYSSIYYRKINLSPIDYDHLDMYSKEYLEAYLHKTSDEKLLKLMMARDNEVALAMGGDSYEAMMKGEYFLSPAGMARAMMKYSRKYSWDLLSQAFTKDEIKQCYRYLKISIQAGNILAYDNLIELIQHYLPEKKHIIPDLAWKCMELGGEYHYECYQIGDEETIDDWKIKFKKAIRIYIRLSQYCHPFIPNQCNGYNNPPRGCLQYLKSVLQEGFRYYPKEIEEVIVLEFGEYLHKIPMIPRFVSKRFSGKNSDQYSIPVDYSKCLKYTMDILRCPLPTDPVALDVYTRLYMPDLGMMIKWDPSVIKRIVG